MATTLRVHLTTCLVLLFCLQVVVVLGRHAHDEFVRNVDVETDDDFRDEHHIRRREIGQPVALDSRRGRDGGGDGGQLIRGQDMAGGMAAAGPGRLNNAPVGRGGDLQQAQFNPNQRGNFNGGGQLQIDQGLGNMAGRGGALPMQQGRGFNNMQQQQFPNQQQQFQPGPAAPGMQMQGIAQNQQQLPQQPLQQQPQQQYPPPKKSRSGPMKPVRIADHPACASDVQRICAKKGNNFAVLDCLQKGENDIAAECNHFLWNYKMNLTKDYRFDNAAAEVCKESIKKFADCNKLEAGQGLILPCLLDHMPNITQTSCTQYLNRMKQITFSDYRLINGFYDTCKADIQRHKCGVVNEDGTSPSNPQAPHSQGGTIHCLEAKVQTLERACKLQILRVAELSSNDYHEDRALYFACREDRERFCAKEVSGQGKIYKCLKDHKFDKEMSEECKGKLTVRQKVIAQDYKVNFRLQRKCKQEIEKAACTMGEAKTKEIKLSTILLCLEKAVKEVDGFTMSGECQAELTDTRKGIMADYMINPELMFECQVEIEGKCHGLRREGKTIHCLMGLAKKQDDLSPGCKKALSDLMEEVDVGSDYRLDPALHSACKETRAALCKNKKDAEVLSCLMENIEDNQMQDVCAEKLLETQYFISRNFRLDPVLFKNCKEDANQHCYISNWSGTESIPSGLIFSCLHRHLHDSQAPLQPRCADQMHRVLRQRAVSVHLNPRIEQECRSDLGRFCTDKTKRGDELRCLQDNLKELMNKCQLAVGNFTVEAGEDIQMNRKLISSCAPMLRQFCQEKLKAKKVDEGEALACLIEHKNDAEMEAKCQASIEHFQLIQLKDYRFSFKFKEACREDVLKLCKGSRDKPSIILCLSEKVRDSVVAGQPPPVKPECRAQLKFELLQRDENIELDPALKKACSYEIKEHCGTVAHGNARILECLRGKQEALGDACHLKVFNREKEMASKPDVDYALMHSCKKLIKTRCKDVAPEKLIDCLKSHKDDPETEPRCKMVLTKRQMERNSNIQLNPQLRKACKMDIHKFCGSLEAEILQSNNPKSNMEGKIIICLRAEFAKKETKLTPVCQSHIRGLIKEGAEDYRLDRTLVKYCSQTIHEKCSAEMETPGSGRVEECLKANVQHIKDPKCQQQVIGLFKEGLADVHVDPLLYKACALDIKHYCAGIPQGQGQQMSCLLEALDEKTVRLQPDCKRMLTERKEMWEYAAQVAPPQGFMDVYAQIRNSPSHHYFMMVFIAFVGILFFFGLCCGRVTKRVRHEIKTK